MLSASKPLSASDFVEGLSFVDGRGGAVGRLKMADLCLVAIGGTPPLRPFDFLDSGLPYRLEDRINVSPKLARVR